jgi:hypothetical protein
MLTLSMSLALVMTTSKKEYFQNNPWNNKKGTVQLNCSFSL